MPIAPLMLLILLLAGLVLAIGQPAAGATSQPIVHVKQGTLEGVRSSVHTDAFYGIPYAEPPTGALRWRPPRPAKQWNGTMRATKLTAHCVQMGTPQYGEPSVDYAQVTAYMGRVDKSDEIAQSEDCLSLNVFRPSMQNRTAGARRCTPPDCNVCAACCHAWIQPGKNCEECYESSCDTEDPSVTNSTPKLLPVLLWIHVRVSPFLVASLLGGLGSSMWIHQLSHQTDIKGQHEAG
eukprot:SAG11_NODE_949_length_6408_cov_16.986210_1_plen_236_part_00